MCARSRPHKNLRSLSDEARHFFSFDRSQHNWHDDKIYNRCIKRFMSAVHFFCTQFSLVKHHIAYFHWWLNTSTLLASIQQQLNTSFSSSWMIILSYTPNLKIFFSFSCWPLNIQCDHTASPKTTTKIQFWWKTQMKKSNASILLELNISKYHHC